MILVLYCLIQFRNRKAQVFNVLYLAIAMVICIKYKRNPGFTLILQQFIDLLRINSSFENFNDITDAFFSTETKSSIVDKETLYRRAYNHCRKLYPGIVAEIVIVKIQNIFKEFDYLSDQTEDTQTAKSLLSLFESDKIAQANYMASKREFREEDKSGKGYARVYECALASKQGLHEKAFGKINEVLCLVAKEDADANALIAAACIFLTGFSIVEESVVNVRELPTFLCEVLANPKGILHCYRRITVSKTQKNSLETLLMGVSLLSKVSFTSLIIPSLFANLNSTLLGYIMADIIFTRNPKATEFLEMMREGTKKVVEKTIRNSIRNENVLGAAINSTSNVGKVIIAATAIHSLNDCLENLLRELKTRTLKPHKAPIKWRVICTSSSEFVKKLAENFNAQFTISSFDKIFISRTKSKLLRQVLQELVSVLAISKTLGVFAISPKGSSLEKFITMQSAPIEPFAKDLLRSFKLIWGIMVLAMIIEATNKVKSEEVVNIKLAALFFRASVISKEYIVHGRQVLKLFNYKIINPKLALHNELMEDLANAVCLYTDESIKAEISKRIEKALFFFIMQ